MADLEARRSHFVKTLPPRSCEDCKGAIRWSEEWTWIGGAYQKHGNCQCRDRAWTLTLPGEGLIDWCFTSQADGDGSPA